MTIVKQFIEIHKNGMLKNDRIMIVETNNLTKAYKHTIATNNVSLKISKGEIYGFLGLNGAGKTTTMRMILGMIKPSHGSFKLFGSSNPKSDKVWSKVGYMIESTYAYPNLTVTENLKVYYHYHNLTDKQIIPQIIARLKLEKYANVRANQLSLGNLQRLGLAKALIHNPELLILDEPVNGLDPSGIVEVRKLLKELSKRGTTILISSHLLTEISKIADTIGIIHNGSLIKEIETKLMISEIDKKLIINTDDNTKTKILFKNNDIQFCMNESLEFEITDTDSLSKPQRIASLIISNGIGLSKLFTYEEDLESYFLRTINSYQI